MSDSNKLASKTYYRVIAVSGNSSGGPDERFVSVIGRKKGYTSFLKESNAFKVATRLSKREDNIGVRFYVVATTSGRMGTAVVTSNAESY